MKKIYLSALMLVSSMSLLAQYEFNHLTDPLGWPVDYPGDGGFDTLDLMVNQSDSALSGTWQNQDKFEIPKNAQGDLTLFGNYMWDNGSSSWVGIFETSFDYTYNGSNQVTNMVQTQGASGYSLVRYADYVINGSGAYTEGNYTDSISYGGITAFKLGKDVLTYDGSGNLTGRVYQESSTNTTTLENDTKYTFTWTGNNLTEIIEQNWDGTSTWENDTRQTMTYDASDRVTVKTAQYWDGSAWVNEEKDEYTYDAQGRLETHSDYIDTAGSWVNEDRITYTYSAGMAIDFWVNEIGNNTNWTNHTKYEMTYNVGQPSFALGHIWDGSAFETSAKLRVLFNDTNAAGGGTTPNAPTNLIANGTGRSTASVSLVWQDNSADEGGFTVERSTDGSSFSSIADLGVDITTFADTTALVAGTQYFYRVIAYNQYGSSAPSNTADATTWPLAVAEVSNGGVSVFPNPAVDQFTIETLGTGTYTLTNMNGQQLQAGSLSIGKNTVGVQGLGHGLYILELHCDDQKSYSRIMIK